VDTEPPTNEVTGLEKLIGDEFVMKKYSIYVLFSSSIYYILSSTIIRGGTGEKINISVNIPSLLLYAFMVVLIKLYGNDKKYQPTFNKVIPLFVLVNLLPNIMFLNISDYESEVIWAF
jgi:hypothetical protein